jgi:hypothetical protein
MKNEMVDRFLAWELPRDFAPNLPSWPIGTNLLTADQAKQMLNHITAPLRQALVDLVGASAPEELKAMRGILETYVCPGSNQASNARRHQRTAGDLG